MVEFLLLRLRLVIALHLRLQESHSTGFMVPSRVGCVFFSVAQSCPTLCGPMDCSLPGSSVHGILKAKLLESVSFPFSRGSSQPRNQTGVSCIAGGSFTRAARESLSIKSQVHFLLLPPRPYFPQ